MEIKCALLLFLITTLFYNIKATKDQRTPKYLFDFLPKATENLSQNKGVNSPIYYIRMPPIPYTFVPGFGYVSTPQNRQDLVNLPLPFLGNGRPVTIYRWSQVPLITTPIEDTKDSSTVRLNGNYVFNGKPNDQVLLLKNQLYDDVLNNMYP